MKTFTVCATLVLPFLFACSRSDSAAAAATSTAEAIAKSAPAEPEANPVPAAPTANTTAPKTEAPTEMTIHSFKVESLDAGPVDLAKYKGDVLLVVNVASECGYTPQYTGLEKLEQELSSKGFHVLGFPSNEFGGQEPGAAADIRKFCTEKYTVTFPLFAKSVTKAGADQSPIFAWLGGATGKLPAWNFSKYLIGRDGKVIAFYPSKVAPEDPALRDEIGKALAAAR